jgi:carbon monoxide dehydrogenase subunit G
MRLTYKLKKTPEYIFDVLTDMQKFVSVHPIIYRIDKTGESAYLVRETLRFAGLPFSFRYPITISSNQKGHQVFMRATVMKMTKIDIRFILTLDSDSTIVEEQITITSLLPVKSILKRIFRRQHEIQFKNIDSK